MQAIDLQQRSHALEERYHSDVRPPRQPSYEELLKRAFEICAPLSLPAPRMPISGHAGIAALSHEIWLQSRDGLIAILANNYDWKDGRLFEAVHISDAGSIETQERFFRVSLCRQSLSEKDLVDIAAALTAFDRNIAQAIRPLDGIAVVPSVNPDIYTVSYLNDRSYRLLNNMIVMHHPDDDEARGHLLMASHMIERIRQNAPASSLC